MKKIFLSMLAVAMFLGAANLCRAADERKPVVVVSFSGYDRLLGDIDVIGRLSDIPHMSQGVEMLLQLLTQGKGLAGLDKTRPWGVVLLTDGEQFTPYGFLPVTDLKQLVEVAKSNPQLADMIMLDDGVYEIETGGPPIYAKQKGKWAVLTHEKEHLANAPTDPLKLFNELPDKYNLAVRVLINNLPDQFREQLLAQLQAVVQVGMAQMPNEDEAGHNARVVAIKQTLDQIVMLVNEAEDFTLGWMIDHNTSTARLDFELTAQNDTKLAQQLATFKSDKTRFAGFLAPKAAATAIWNRTLTDADVARAKNTLAAVRESLVQELKNQGLGQADLKRATHLADQLFNVLKKNVETKHIEGGLSVLLDPAAATVIAGTTVADDAKLEEILKELIAEIREGKPATADAIKCTTETYEGIRLHVFTVPTPEPRWQPLVGDKLEVIVGIGDHRLLVAAGRDAMKTLKTAIDRSMATNNKDVLPIEISLSAARISRFIAQVAEEEDVKAKAEMLAGILQRAGNEDHVTLSVVSIPQGVRVRLECEQGLLKALGSLSPMGGPPPGGTPR